MSNFGKFSVPNPKNWLTCSSGSLNLGQNSDLKEEFCQKKSVQQVPKFGTDPFYKPPFLAIRAAYPNTHIQTKVE